MLTTMQQDTAFDGGDWQQKLVSQRDEEVPANINLNNLQEEDGESFWCNHRDGLLDPNVELNEDLKPVKRPSIPAYLFKLREGESLKIYGSIFFRVIRGLVEVGGHIFHPSEEYHPVVSPPWSPFYRLLALRPLCVDQIKGNNLDTLSELEDAQLQLMSSCEDAGVQSLYGGSAKNITQRLLLSFQLARHGHLVDTEAGEAILRLRAVDKAAKKISAWSAGLQEECRLIDEEEFPVILSITVVRSLFGDIPLEIALSPMPLSPRKAMIIPPIWEFIMMRYLRKIVEARNSGKCPPSLVIWGNQNNGKSTFCMYAINYLLNVLPKVAVLDTDLGQPLFTVPGILSLSYLTTPILRPPHSLVSYVKPDKTFYIGAASPRNCLKLYSSAVVHLQNSYINCYKAGRSRYKMQPKAPYYVPLVVNTHGWVKKMGLSLLKLIFKITNASLAVELGTKDSSKSQSKSLHATAALSKVKASGMDSVSAAMKKGLYYTLEQYTSTDAFFISESAKEKQDNDIEAQDTAVAEDSDTFNFSVLNPLEQIVRLAPDITKKRNLFECVRIHSFEDIQRELEPEIKSTCCDSGKADAMPKDLRKLRVMSWFNPAIQAALQFPSFSLETFYGGQLGLISNPFVISPKYWGPGPAYAFLSLDTLWFLVSCSCQYLEKISDKLTRILPGSLVTLCSQDDKPFKFVTSKEKQKVPKLIASKQTVVDSCCEFISCAYVHSVNLQEGWVSVYVPRFILGELHLVNVLALGDEVEFHPSPKRSYPTYYLPAHPEIDAAKFASFQSTVDNFSKSSMLPYTSNEVLSISGSGGTGARTAVTRQNLLRKSQG